jgi:hypothetical protein
MAREEMAVPLEAIDQEKRAEEQARAVDAAIRERHDVDAEIQSLKTERDFLKRKLELRALRAEIETLRAELKE